jgi:hypothetical protein
VCKPRARDRSSSLVVIDGLLPEEVIDALIAAFHELVLK